MYKNTFIMCIFFGLLLQAFSQTYSVSTINLSWMDNVDSTNITMTNTMNSSNWFAFGLSNDQDMVINFI